MASFCGNCGSPVGANVGFCPQCGAKQAAFSGAAHQAPPPAAPVPQSPPPAAKSGSGLKILMIVLACFGILGMVVVGGVYYVVHKVKQTMVEKAHSYGVDLPSSSPAPAFGSRTRSYKPCDLLSKQEVSNLLGEPIERNEVQSQSCLYYGPAGLSAKLAEEKASGTFRRAQAPGSQVGGAEVADSVDQLANSLGAAQGQTGSRGEMPLLILGVDADGKSQMAALSASKAIFGGISNASGAGNGLVIGKDIPGLGDRAMLFPKLGLNVLQGETMIRIIPGPVPDANAKSMQIARVVLKKL
jgi:hypothetical protein